MTLKDLLVYLIENCTEVNLNKEIYYSYINEDGECTVDTLEPHDIDFTYDRIIRLSL